MSLLPVDEALRQLLDGVAPLPPETVPLADAAFRALAADVVARRTQPPVDVSAMDGYAVRAADVGKLPARLRLIGEAAAGRGLARSIGPGETARIFTGAPVPAGADTILIQENAVADGSTIEATETVVPGRHIRRAGIDFTEGDALLPAGTVATPAAIALAASADHALLSVIRKPRVAILMTGDELVLPGEPRGPHQIVASNGFGIAALASGDGAEITRVGLVRDERKAIAAELHAARAAGADVLVTIGGASVGDYDLVNGVLTAEGVSFDFWKIAMRPGKPLMVGRWGAMRVLGLPGNPVSSFVCAHLFLRPLIARLAGRSYRAPLDQACLGVALPQNDSRRDYLRARIEHREGRTMAYPFQAQDSSHMSAFARADALIVREANAPDAAAGDACTIYRLA